MRNESAKLRLRRVVKVCARVRDRVAGPGNRPSLSPTSRSRSTAVPGRGARAELAERGPTKTSGSGVARPVRQGKRDDEDPSGLESVEPGLTTTDRFVGRVSRGRLTSDRVVPVVLKSSVHHPTEGGVRRVTFAGNGRGGCFRPSSTVLFTIMATNGKSTFLWSCPKCGQKAKLHVRATEVVCTNKAAHTSSAVQMLLAKKAS